MNTESDRKEFFNYPLDNLEDLLIFSNKEYLYRTVIEAVEKPLIEKVLQKTQGNQLKAAKILGINRNTLHAKIKKLGINMVLARER